MNLPAPLPTAEAPPGPRLTGTLKVFGADGANVGELLIHADGSTRIRDGSEPSLLRSGVEAVRGFDLRRFGNRQGK